MDTVISASSLIPAGIVVTAIGLAIAYGVKEGKTNARIESLEKADANLNESIKALINSIEDIKRGAMPTNERLIAIEIEQKQQRRILEQIQEHLEKRN